jgi:hypothetical protein|tara:strand:- start:326 stop:622 length:297 start_codon:yes stop_codon:yes gene_type:complete
MGRILRYNMQEDVVIGVDFGFPRAGKLLIRNAGTRDVRIGYDPRDVDQTTGVNYFTIEPGIVYTFDMSASSGFLEQDQQLYMVCTTGANEVEIWFAHQ